MPALSDAIDDAITPGDQTIVLGVIDARGQTLMGNEPVRVMVPARPTAFRVAALNGAVPAREVTYALHPLGRYWR